MIFLYFIRREHNLPALLMLQKKLNVLWIRAHGKFQQDAKQLENGGCTKSCLKANNKQG